MNPTTMIISDTYFKKIQEKNEKNKQYGEYGPALLP
jgi:hypothetical protein